MEIPSPHIVHTPQNAKISSFNNKKKKKKKKKNSNTNSLLGVVLPLVFLGLLSLSLPSCLRIAGKLNRDLAIKDLLSGEFSNGTLSLARCREFSEAISNWAVGTWAL